MSITTGQWSEVLELPFPNPRNLDPLYLSASNGSPFRMMSTLADSFLSARDLERRI